MGGMGIFTAILLAAAGAQAQATKPLPEWLKEFSPPSRACV